MHACGDDMKHLLTQKNLAGGGYIQADGGDGKYVGVANSNSIRENDRELRPRWISHGNYKGPKGGQYHAHLHEIHPETYTCNSVHIPVYIN